MYPTGIGIIFIRLPIFAARIFAHQDGGGRECIPTVIREWAAALKSSADTEGIRFWINNETFQTDGTSKPIAALQADYNTTADLAEEHILFSWNHYYNPLVKPGYQAISETFAEFSFQSVKGDVNADSVCSIADVVVLQKWFSAAPNAVLADWKAADLCEDDILNASDLCAIKQILLQ